MCGAGRARGQDIAGEWASPTLDRWMYPFNFSNGLETQSPIFGAILQAGFDDRDSQLLVGFNTAPTIPSGLGLDRYRIESAVLTVTMKNDMVAAYDPTPDSVRTLYPVGDPEATTDTDPGKPIEVFAAGYRNGWTLASFMERSPFGGAPIVPPAEGARNVFAATIADGVATDVSRQVRERFDATPLAIGMCPTVTPGALIPAGSVFTFALSPCDSGVRSYLGAALDQGKLNLVVTSLEPASGGPGGGTGDPAYPILYTKEAGLGFQATLSIRVRVGHAADFNGDGSVDFFDYDDFVGAFESGLATGDFNQDCSIDFFDYDDFVLAFEGA
jgi:hypothetical protein